MTGGSGVRGFLFADLRGYTRFIEAHGDAAAAELLADYRDLVRGIVGRHEGAEIRTEGDGVYVVFESVTSAVDAGLELVEAAAAATAASPARPIRVAVGIHAGETTATGEGPVGSAVNIAARICAKAEAGEVLVSETVRSLVRTARPYRSTALGGQHLKGVAETVNLYRLERAPSSLGTRLRRQARARRGRLAALGILAAAVLVVSGAAWAANRPPDCLALAKDTRDVVVRIDPARGCVTQVVPAGLTPGAIVATSGTLWVADRTGWTITRIDATAGEVEDWFGVPGSPVSMAANAVGGVVVLAFDDRTISGSGTESRHRVLDIGSDRPAALAARLLPTEKDRKPVGIEIPVNASSYASLAPSGGWTWVTSARGTLLRVKANGLVTMDLAALGASRPSVIASAGGTVWIADEQAPHVYRYDGAVDRPTETTLSGSVGSTALAATPDGLWIVRKDDTITRLDAATGRQATLTVGGHPTRLIVGPDRLWLVDPDARAIRAVDPATGQALGQVGVGGVPADAVLVDGQLWVTVAGN